MNKRIALNTIFEEKQRDAFTLLELLIVLGLIVALMGIGFPSVQRTYVKSRLKGTAQELQSELYRTRLEAMKSGKAYVFRYGNGTSTFEVLPKEIYDQRESSKDGFGAVAVGSELLAETPTAKTVPEGTPGTVNVYQKTLPDRVVFGDVHEFQGGWSAPILFYPNGRTSQASMVLRTTGRNSFRQQLILRGLTGTARIVEE